jgi:hypothetical protein
MTSGHSKIRREAERVYRGHANRLPLSADNEYSVAMQSCKGQWPVSIEVIGDDMARILRGRTGAERLRIASGMYASARHMLLNHLRAEHADWDERRIVQEAARRLSHGAT